MATRAIALVAGAGLAAIAYGAGRRRGRLAERVAVNRYLHDTVLPTLDAVSLGARPDAARALATGLRRGLREQIRPRRFDQELAEVITELAREGLRVRLELAEPGTGLPARHRAALRDATREALRNTRKHAGTDHAEVRVERRAEGVAVIVWDNGAGFDPDRCGRGFGIAESIVARMAEVDGTAVIESRPGRGTRVELWVPR